jgi:hypothetical protein
MRDLREAPVSAFVMSIAVPRYQVALLDFEAAAVAMKDKDRRTRIDAVLPIGFGRDVCRNAEIRDGFPVLYRCLALLLIEPRSEKLGKMRIAIRSATLLRV